MPTAENAKLQYEAGQDFVDYTELSDSGDNQIFTSDAEFWSRRSGYEPTIRPNGIVSGGAVSAADSGSDDVVDIAALTCYLAGTLTSITAETDFSITRPGSDKAKISSITINSGGTITEVEGTIGTGTSFSTIRGAAGGPPYIPTGSIELAQVRLTANASAAITASEIKQVVGTHKEAYDFPVWSTRYTRNERKDWADENEQEYAHVKFADTLDEIHSDDAGSTTSTKKVYASYYEPSFAEQPDAYEFVPPENSHSVNSTQVYNRTVGSTSMSLNQGSFSALLDDGVDDNILQFKDEFLWFRFYPDRNKSPYISCQGKLGMTGAFPAGGNINASFTISAESASRRVSS